MSIRAGLLALCAACAACAAAGPVSIELLPQAKVVGPDVVLGDVAILHAEDLALMRKLVNLPLGRAPQAGDIALLQREALAQWVRRESGVAQERLAWSGAAQARVLRSTPQVSGHDIVRAAVDTLRSRGQQGDIHARVTPRDVDVPAGAVRLEARGAEHGVSHNHAVLWVDVWAAERFVRTVPVSLEVTPSEAFASSAPVLRQASPEIAPPAVMRGDWAVLRSSDGVITVESRVEVLQDGRPGQKIRVRAHGATGPAFARVVGRGQLELAP